MKRYKKGITLIELIVVIAIIIILASVLLPYTASRLEDARISRTEQEISTIKSAMILFYNDNATFPSNWSELASPPATLPNWRGPYIDRLPNTTNLTWTSASPWKTDYRLHRPASGSNPPYRFASTTNLYQFSTGIALEITNPLSGGIPTISLTSLQKIDADMDNSNASSGFIVEANANTNPFVTTANMAGLTTTPTYAGAGKSVYILLFTY